jgi:hypothetical protein
MPDSGEGTPDRPPTADLTLESFLSGEDVDTGRRVSPFLIGIGVALILFGVADLMWSRSGDADPVAAPTTTTTASITTTTEATTTTTTPATTSSTAAPTTTTTVQPIINPTGEPVTLEDLTLGAVALGPLEVGAPADEVLGRLAGGLGQPDAVDAITGEYGLCPDTGGQLIRWGALSIITRDTANGPVFAGYRVDNQADEPTAAIPTISGLQTGDTVADLESVYSGLTVNFPNESTFVLESATAVLLWGPVTSSDDAGIVTGIYSRNACDGSAG